MARRRRKKGNPLLAKIVVATLAAHAVALPILAHFGAFKEIQRQLNTSRVVMVTMPPLEKEKPAEKAAKKKAAPVKKAPGGAPKTSAASRSNVPQPKVVASAATPGEGGSGGGPTVDPNGSGKAGALPPGAGGPAKTPPPVEKPPTPEPKPEPKVEPPVTKPPEPAPKPPVVEPPPAKPIPAPRRIVQAEAIDSPQPTIPDDLRAEPFEKTLIVEADVDTGGHPTNVKIAEGTGVKALDDAGLDAARRYKFKPATVDDAPVEQHVRFRIIFKVE